MRGSATRADRRGTTGRRFASNLAGAGTAGASADTNTNADDTNTAKDLDHHKLNTAEPHVTLHDELLP